MTDQPPTCPKCGRRVVCLEGCGEKIQIVKCPGCYYEYQLEDDGEWEEDQAEADRHNKYIAPLWVHASL